MDHGTGRIIFIKEPLSIFQKLLPLSGATPLPLPGETIRTVGAGVLALTVTAALVAVAPIPSVVAGVITSTKRQSIAKRKTIAVLLHGDFVCR
jgi:hypothetical protein